jgi:NAD(P)-dependent dehydrogenase (short-subunit alcohol dehydrogenase family)
MPLSNQTIVITGGNGALGAVVAECAKELGARTVLIDQQFGAALLAAHECHCLDLTSVDSLSKVLAGVGPVDALFAIAGGFDMGLDVDDPDDRQWHAMFERNVQTLRSVLKAVVPGMRTRRSGSIVSVGALSAREGKAQMSAYTASKAVVMNITESLATEMRGHGVRVNAVLPSIIDTAANRAAMPDADVTQWVKPAALADVMCFLASHAGRGVHGALLPVTGSSVD